MAAKNELFPNLFPTTVESNRTTSTAILDPAGAQQAAQEGMALAASGSGADRYAKALAAISRLARTNAKVTADDVTVALGGSAGAAMGTAFVEAARAGIIRKTKDYVPSSRKVTHGRPIAVWESLLKA